MLGMSRAFAPVEPVATHHRGETKLARRRGSRPPSDRKPEFGDTVHRVGVIHPQRP